MPMRLVLDTQVVLDLMHFHDRHAESLRAALASGAAECWTDDDALAELQRVLGYPELRLEPCAAGEIFRRYTTLAQRHDVSTPPPTGLPRCKDPDDQKFVQLAACIGADCLVSRDKALLRLNRRRGMPCPVLTPALIATLPGFPAVQSPI